MTLNGAVAQLAEMRDNSLMPEFFRPYFDKVIETIKSDAVPAEKQKTGKWIKMSDADGTYYCCSECGEELYREWTFNSHFARRKSIAKTKYCPHCGARMEGEQDG